MSKRKKKQKQFHNHPVSGTSQHLNYDDLYQDVCRDIDNHVAAASKIIKKTNPLILLKRAFDNYTFLSLRDDSENDFRELDPIALRMIDYIQCLIVSITPIPNHEHEELTQELWGELTLHIEGIFAKLALYFINYAKKQQQEGTFDSEWNKFYIHVQLTWCLIRGDRHANFFSSHLLSLLEPHDDIFIELFRVSANQFVNELAKLQDSLRTGLINSITKIDDLRESFFEELAEKNHFSFNPQLVEFSENDNTAFLKSKLDEYGYRELFDTELNKFTGFDLFDIQKITCLPNELLDELSLAPGEDQAFLYNEPFKGWPLNLPPTWNKPFLKLNNKYYCIDAYSLSDNIYRAIEKAISRQKPEYKVIWNERQKKISEKIALITLSNLLPNATVYENVFYEWETGANKRKNWIECDGLILYDDHLFVVEVKAGSFTYTSPATDTPAYINSIKELLLKPANQGLRFLEYLKSADSVKICDTNHNSIARLSYKQFRHVTICCITLDQLSHLAAKLGQLKVIDDNLKNQNIWSVSIDDLRVYADILSNPLQFLHFIEQRIKAFSSQPISLTDELDHLGMYLHHNRYTEYAKDILSKKIKPSDHVIWSGYTNDIDNYYSRVLRDEQANIPKQTIPEILGRILDILVQKKKVGKARVASILLDMSYQERTDFADMIKDIVSHTKQRRKPIPFSIRKTNISIYCHVPEVSFSAYNFKEYGLANMIIGNDEERLLLELYFDESENIIDVRFDLLDKDFLESYGKHKLIPAVDKLIANRFTNALKEKRSIGRNDLCPCGSGKKYKHCHGSSNQRKG